MPASRIRIAGRLELPAINSVIELALADWNITERARRLALPVYRYQQGDLDYMWLLVAEDEDGSLSGVAALEEAARAELPEQVHGLLLHGIFVKPEAMGRGIGRQLVAASAGIARELGYGGLLVKSVRQSRGFFERCGLDVLSAADAGDYPYRYWLATEAATSATANPGQLSGQNTVTGSAPG